MYISLMLLFCLITGLPPLVLRRILEILAYLATNHSAVANMLFNFDRSIISEPSSSCRDTMKDKGKEKVSEGEPSKKSVWDFEAPDVPLIIFLKLLNRPLFLRSSAHLEQVMGLIQVIVLNATSKLESESQSEKEITGSQNLAASEASGDFEKDPPLLELDSDKQDKHADKGSCHSNVKKSVDMYNIFLQLPQVDLSNLCSLLGREGYGSYPFYV